jgi:hypothetical protein
VTADASLVVCQGIPNVIDAAYVIESFLDLVPGGKCLQELAVKGEAIEDVTCILVRREYRMDTRNIGHNARSRCLDGLRSCLSLINTESKA